MNFRSEQNEARKAFVAAMKKEAYRMNLPAALEQKVKYTPGPWELAPSGYRVVWIGRNSIGEISYSAVICDTANNAATRTPTNNANARLIAAAPEMLEALEQADFFLSHSGNQRAIISEKYETPSGRWDQFQKTREMVKAVIRKAKGEL